MKGWLDLCHEMASVIYKTTKIQTVACDGTLHFQFIRFDQVVNLWLLMGNTQVTIYSMKH